MEPAAQPPSDAAVKDALRIQAAAVAAQQAALDDEEARLQQRRGALEQQEEQLAANLEEKRRRLVQLREEVQADRLALQKERAVNQEAVEKNRRDLTQTQKEVLHAQEQAQAERKRLVELRQRLQRRWQRHCMTQQRALRQRETALSALRHALDREGERLQTERADFAQLRLRASGAIELGKRQLQDAWQRLHSDQQAWQAHRQREFAALKQRTRALERGAVELAQAQRDLAYDCYQWQGQRRLLEREAEGLDARVLNQRHKLKEQQEESNRLEAVLGKLRPAAAGLAPVTVPAGQEPGACPAGAGGPAPAETTAPAAAAASALPAMSSGVLVVFSASTTGAADRRGPLAPEPNSLTVHKTELAATESSLQRRVRVVERLAGDLADQRLQLVEQWQRLAHAQARWQHDRDAAAAELETVALRLPEREQALVLKEQEQEAAARALQRRHMELIQERQHLEAWQVRLRAREAAWEAQRDRLLADLGAREETAERLQAAMVELRQALGRRRKQELEELRGQRCAADKVRQEWLALRAEWWQRTTELEEQQRALADKELALERHRQQFLTGTEDAAAAERGLERLQRRLAQQNAAAVRATQEARRKLEAERAQLQAQAAVLQKQSQELTERAGSLAEQQTTLEAREALACSQEIRMREEVQRLRAQRDRYEQQAGELQDEVERIAVLLLQESDEILPRAA